MILLATVFDSENNESPRSENGSKLIKLIKYSEFNEIEKYCTCFDSILNVIFFKYFIITFDLLTLN